MSPPSYLTHPLDPAAVCAQLLRCSKFTQYDVTDVTVCPFTSVSHGVASTDGGSDLRFGIVTV